MINNIPLTVFSIMEVKEILNVLLWVKIVRWMQQN